MSSKTETAPVLMAKPEEENQLSPNPAGFGFTKMLFVDSLPVGGELKTLYALKVKKDGEVIGYSYFVWDSQTGFTYAPFAGSVPNMKVADGGRSKAVRTENAPKEAPEKVFYGLVVFHKEPMIKGLPLSEYIDKTGGVTHAELEAAIASVPHVSVTEGTGDDAGFVDTIKIDDDQPLDVVTPSKVVLKNQGAENVGKILIVGADGNLTLTDMPEGDVVGYVDSSNNIVLNGNLADGTYTVKYVLADDSTVDIGELVLDTNVYRSVTNNLTNCTNSNDAISAVDGESYSATISADDGYGLSSLVVTMGDTDITSSVVSGGSISIASVTGDIVITAVAEETVVEITNWIEEVGYTTNVRLSISTGGETTSGAEGCETTGYIPVNAGDILRLKNITTGLDSKNVLLYFDSSKVKIDSDYTATVFATDEGNGVYVSSGLRNPNGMAYIRFTSENIDDTSIVTINEEIV